MEYKALHGSTIFAVDDNPNNLAVLVNFLKKQNIDIRIATSGRQALERVEKIMPDLILLDIMMPETDGYEICNKLKLMERIKDIPVIFMTALSKNTNELMGFKVGAVDYITKPLNLPTTLSRLNTHLMIQKQKKELIKLNAEKDSLFSVIAHELRSPMLNMIAQEHFLKKSISTLNNPELMENLNQLKDSTENIFILLEDLLHWALVQLGKMKYNPEKIDLLTIINETISFLKESKDKKNIKIVIQNSDAVTIFSDSEMIKIILRNLLNNAIKFSNTGDKIIINYYSSEDDLIEISITDNGEGIADCLKCDIFQNKYLTSETGTRGEKGTGLGLLLCRELVEKNGGKIWYSSEKKKGTTFYFTLQEPPMELV